MSERIFAADESAVVAVPDEGIVELAAAIKNPALEAAFSQPDVSGIEAACLREVGPRIRSGGEDPIAMHCEHCY